jgi:hypothetical protein
MKYGLDCLHPPTDAQARTMRGLGWEWLNVYVGGPYLSGHTPWPRDRIAALARLDFRFLPLFVGQQRVAGMAGELTYERGIVDGAEATAAAGIAGFQAGDILGLDLESGNPISEAREYVRGWVEVVNGEGHQACLYCDPSTAHYLGSPDLVDYVWVADWVVFGLRAAPVGRFNPADDPPWDAWQFGTGSIAGVPVDFDSATDGFPFAAHTTG